MDDRELETMGGIAWRPEALAALVRLFASGAASEALALRDHRTAIGKADAATGRLRRDAVRVSWIPAMQGAVIVTVRDADTGLGYSTEWRTAGAAPYVHDLWEGGWSMRPEEGLQPPAETAAVVELLGRPAFEAAIRSSTAPVWLRVEVRPERSSEEMRWSAVVAIGDGEHAVADGVKAVLESPGLRVAPSEIEALVEAARTALRQPGWTSRAWQLSAAGQPTTRLEIAGAVAGRRTWSATLTWWGETLDGVVYQAEAHATHHLPADALRGLLSEVHAAFALNYAPRYWDADVRPLQDGEHPAGRELDCIWKVEGR